MFDNDLNIKAGTLDALVEILIIDPPCEHGLCISCKWS